MDIIIPESIKGEFEFWYLKQDGYPIRLQSFYFIPYVFQSGVYKAYLRSKGIIINVASIHDTEADTFEFKPIVNRRIFDKWGADHDQAEIAAINAGFQLRAEQLEVKEI